MINYVPINLSNRKFYVGSTTDFGRRWKQHLKSNADYPFQNALRKNPDKFFVLISEDDGLETREEEQFYLDFYQGSEWCYNLSDSSYTPGKEACRKGGSRTAFLVPLEVRSRWIERISLEQRSNNGRKSMSEKDSDFFRNAQKKSSDKRKKPVRGRKVGVNGEWETFDSLRGASRSTGVSAGNICKCIQGVRSQAGGYHWQFAEVK
jgi:group I intron endonuclease